MKLLRRIICFLAGDGGSDTGCDSAEGENFMKNSWKETLAGDEALQLKVTDKRTKAYVGYAILHCQDFKPARKKDGSLL